METKKDLASAQQLSSDSEYTQCVNETAKVKGVKDSPSPYSDYKTAGGAIDAVAQTEIDPHVVAKHVSSGHGYPLSFRRERVLLRKTNPIRGVLKGEKVLVLYGVMPEDQALSSPEGKSGPDLSIVPKTHALTGEGRSERLIKSVEITSTSFSELDKAA